MQAIAPPNLNTASALLSLWGCWPFKIGRGQDEPIPHTPQPFTHPPPPQTHCSAAAGEKPVPSRCCWSTSGAADRQTDTPFDGLVGRWSDGLTETRPPAVSHRRRIALCGSNSSRRWRQRQRAGWRTDTRTRRRYERRHAPWERRTRAQVNDRLSREQNKDSPAVMSPPSVSPSPSSRMLRCCCHGNHLTVWGHDEEVVVGDRDVLFFVFIYLFI